MSTTSSKELKLAEKEMHKADKQFAAAEKAYEKGNVKAAEKHENRANALAASAQEHAAHAQQVGILASGVTQPHSVFGAHHGSFTNTGAWNGGFMNVAPSTLYRGRPIGNYNPTHTYPADHPYYHENFSHNGTPLGKYNTTTAYSASSPYNNSIIPAAATGTGLTAAAIPVALATNHQLGNYHGSYNNGSWTGGFMNTSPTTLYQGHAIGNYDPFHTYPADHPYYHGNYKYNNQPLGAYDPSATYAAGHPYYGLDSHTGLGSGLSSGLGSGLGVGSGLGAGTGLGLGSGLGLQSTTGGFGNVSPTTLYQGQQIGNYNPTMTYPADHPYHHSNFQYQGQPLSAYVPGTSYPGDHPYYTFANQGAVTSVTTVPYTSPFGAHHGTYLNGRWVGGFMNVSPSTIYNGQAIGDYNPAMQYPQDHPYHSSHFQYQGQPLGAYNQGTTYPQGHPWYQGLSTVTSGSSSFGQHHGMFQNNSWTGGFMNTAPTTLYQGQPIGSYDPFRTYPADHPYYASNYQYQGQPLTTYTAGTSYPIGHPYYGIGTGAGTGTSSGAGTGGIMGKIKSLFGSNHGSPNSTGKWQGGFYNVAPTTVYQGTAIGDYDPYHTYPAGHPYYPGNFSYNGQPLTPYVQGQTYPADHPYYSIGSGSSLGTGMGTGLNTGIGAGASTGTGIGLNTGANIL